VTHTLTGFRVQLLAARADTLAGEHGMADMSTGNVFTLSHTVITEDHVVPTALLDTGLFIERCFF
jgi:hypothetical protein